MRVLLAVEDPGRALEALEVDAGDLHDRALRGQRTPQHGEAADRVERVVHAVDDLAVGGGRGDEVEVLAHRAPGDRDLVEVEGARLGQQPHDDGDAADPVEVGHVVATVGLRVARWGTRAATLLKSSSSSSTWAS